MSGEGWQAELDQMQAGGAQVADSIRTYYQAMLSRGFSKDQAFTLVLQLHAHLWAVQLKVSPGSSQ